MVENADISTVASLSPSGDANSLTTPAGLQAIATLKRRRWIVFTLNLATLAALLAWGGSILSAGGWTWLDVAALICFAIGTPWAALGFWNAIIGLLMLHGRRDGLHEVAPYLAAADRPASLTVSTAVVMTLRNEDPARAVLRLQTVKRSLETTREGATFSYFLLSDTDAASVAASEEAAVAAWRASGPGRDRIFYRRRAGNAGYKAGNIREFCESRGRDFELMLLLDADSLMTGAAIVRLARIMQAHPKIGILQSLVVGAPSSSAFARIFQFGMRHGMRAYTMGQAWWVGDCGPFWGHNALVRIKPFVAACSLPTLSGRPPLGGPILSHDQVEAALMRRAGYEVRVMPVEEGSFEDSPPDALEFIRRDVRWCQGNMQYLKLLDLPGLQPISRFQLAWAILMFASVPAWTFLIAALPFIAADAMAIADFPIGSAKALYVTFLLIYLSPRLSGLFAAALTPGEVTRFGGAPRFAASAAMEIVFSFLLGAVTTIRTSLFMIGLPFGASSLWSGQQRDARSVSWRAAAAALWPQCAFGAIVCSALAAVSPTILVWSLPLTAGYLLAVPFAVISADPRVGAFLRRRGLAAIPEDFNPPVEVASLQRAG